MAWHEYHCIEPKISADVTALSNTEWKARAEELVAQLKQRAARPDPPETVGCVCLNGSHRLLTEAEITTLRAAGFKITPEAYDDDSSDNS